MEKITKGDKLRVLKNALKAMEDRRNKGWGFLLCIRIQDSYNNLGLNPKYGYPYISEISGQFDLLRFKPKNKRVGDGWWEVNKRNTAKRIKIIKQLIKELEEN